MRTVTFGLPPEWMTSLFLLGEILTRGQWPYRRAASETKSGLRFETGNLICTHIHVDIAHILLVNSEATKVSKQPQRPNLTSDMKSVTSITCVLNSKVILLVKQGSDLRVAAHMDGNGKFDF